MKATTIVVIIVGILFIFAIFAIATYNKLIGAKELLENAKGQIAAQIESRWDLISNLISATKQYAEYEAETLENTVRMRARVDSESEVGELEEADANYQGVLGRLIAVAENYPDLKASNVYQQTMSSISESENRVRLSRMTLNDTVTKYNRIVATVPTNIIAGMFGFHREKYFEETQGKEEMPLW